MSVERGKHANHSAFIELAEKEMVKGHLWMIWTSIMIIVVMVVSHTNYADKMRANDCGRQCCRPCTGRQNQGWWSRMLSVWFYVAIGSLSYISFERPSELAHNYDLLLEVDQWKILEAKVTALQAAGALSDTDVGRLMATKPTPGDQTNNWNASEYRGTRKR
jgi:hypothetical protein